MMISGIPLRLMLDHIRNRKLTEFSRNKSQSGPIWIQKIEFSIIRSCDVKRNRDDCIIYKESITGSGYQNDGQIIKLTCSTSWIIHRDSQNLVHQAGIEPAPWRFRGAYPAFGIDA